jgi:hypothetical protein
MKAATRFLRDCNYLAPLAGFAVACVLFVEGPRLFFGTDKPAAQQPLEKELAWQDPQQNIRVAIRNRTARSVLEMANLLLISALGYVLFSSGRRLARLPPRLGDRFGTVLVASFGVLLLLLLWVDSPYNLFWVNSIPDNLFAEACERAGSKRLHTLSWATQFLAQVMMLVVAAETSMILASLKSDPKRLGRQLARIGRLTQLTSLTMVLFSLEAGAEVLWPASLLPPDDDKFLDDIRHLAVGQALDLGIYNSLLLTLVFVPAVLICTSHIRKTVDSIYAGVGSRKRDEILAAHGLATNAVDFFKGLAVVLSPLLAGLPLVKFVTFIL